MDNALYIAKTGVVKISVANSNLNGDGEMGLAFTAGERGAFINSIRIKATDKVGAGMVRLFVTSGEERFLFLEIKILGIEPSSNSSTYSKLLVFANGTFTLGAGQSIYAATQNDQTFNVIVEALDWTY